MCVCDPHNQTLRHTRTHSTHTRSIRNYCSSAGLVFLKAVNLGLCILCRVVEGCGVVIISFFSVGGDSGAQRRVTEECGVVIKSFVGWSVRLSVGRSVGRSVGPLLITRLMVIGLVLL